MFSESEPKQQNNVVLLPVEDEPTATAAASLPLFLWPAAAAVTTMPILLARCHSVVAGTPCDSAA